MSPRTVYPVLLALASASLGCAAVVELLRNPSDTVLPHVSPDLLYDELAPYYVELCAVSQYRPLDGTVGGIPGHAVMSLKGACVDESAPYPRLRPCKYVTADPDAPSTAGRVAGTVHRYAGLDELMRNVLAFG